MISVETYTEEHFLDVVHLVESFHREAAGEWLGLFSPDALIEHIKTQAQTNARDAFLLLIDGVAKGIIFGVRAVAPTTGETIFQEMIWYVDPSHRRHGIRLLNEVEKILKSQGVSIMIMAVLENSKTDKLKAFYERVGYRPMEMHFMRRL